MPDDRKGPESLGGVERGGWDRVRGRRLRAAIAAAFTPLVIRSSSGREAVRVCGRSIDVATDEAQAGREQPDEPGCEPCEPDEEQRGAVGDREVAEPRG